MIRVSSYAQNQVLQANMASTQAKVSDRTVQISSGKVTQEYTNIALQSLELVSLQRDNIRTTQFEKNVQSTETRLEIMETNLTTATERITKLLGDILNGLNGSNIQEIPFEEFARGFRSELTAVFNAQHEGRYLFSGSLTDTPPIDVNDVAYTPQAGLPGVFTADFDYYQGDNVKLGNRIDQDTTLAYGITGDDPAIEKLLRGLSYVEYAGLNDDTSVLQEAYNLLQQSLDGISSMRSQIGAQLSVLDSSKKNHADYKTYVQNTISSIEDVDIAEATSRLAFDQVQLQASYISLTRINETTLLNYIR
ncbi:flagellin [Kiloniella laminariae]|uniref:Flagellin n=1 Tax=Kiloniella laminariae TaxID=454162 RepID=A0ABT4LHC3_9PROT|nr:flagellin [Kiloniella laminariae]MCZ4280502.1 flagellin [Kiloniella laminariae]